MKPLNLAAFYDVHKINVGHLMKEVSVMLYSRNSAKGPDVVCTLKVVWLIYLGAVTLTFHKCVTCHPNAAANTEDCFYPKDC